MAFVSRSERELNSGILSQTNIGPGEYSNNESKEEARALHKLSNIFTHRTKLTPLEINIPFNSTSKRKSLLLKTNTNPGPGAYLNTSFDNKIKKNLPFFTLRDEIIFVQENEDLVPKIKKEKKGFLSSEKRFFEKIDVKNVNNFNKNAGLENYKFNSRYIFNKENEKMNNNRYSKNDFSYYKNNLTHRSLPDNSNTKPTIPDKNTGNFKFINGKIEEVEKRISNTSKNKEDELGPGKYEIFPKWTTNSINWKYGHNKESKIISFKNKLITELKEHEKNDKINLSMKFNNKKLFKNISNSNILKTDITETDNLKKNNSMRNQVFNRHIKDRKKFLSEQMNKQKKYNEIINQFQYKETPGPGFYNNNKIPPITIFNTNKSQNFGSNTPKFSKISDEDYIVGPGSYFIEKNKYQPKIEVTVHPKNPERKNLLKNNGGFYVKNYRLKNKYRYPGPGQYNLSKNFIKEQISNIKSFGILEERFKYKNLNLEENDNYNEIINEKINRQLYVKTNYDFDDKIQYKMNRKFLELKRQEEMIKKKRRDKFMNKKSPAVGDYSPEFSTSISYNVKSKLNKYRNDVAPFNIMDARFSKDNKIFLNKDMPNPGPGEYDVAEAFEALKDGIKNGYINKSYNNNDNYNNIIENNPIKIKNNDVPSIQEPEKFNKNLTNSWNKKSFNVLFIEK